jgi:hypothetical protein
MRGTTPPATPPSPRFGSSLVEHRHEGAAPISLPGRQIFRPLVQTSARAAPPGETARAASSRRARPGVCHTTKERDQTVIICDFCCSPEVLWSYPAANFHVEGAPLASEGGWAACHDCAVLIEADDREGLAQRALSSAPKFMRERCLPFMRALHAQFFQARRGPARPAPAKGAHA